MDGSYKGGTSQYRGHDMVWVRFVGAVFGRPFVLLLGTLRENLFKRLVKLCLGIGVALFGSLFQWAEVDGVAALV